MRGKYVAGLAAALALAAPAAAIAGPPAPVDPQNWTFQDNFTWNDYHPLPGKDYSDPAIVPTVKKWKVALVLTDFPDKTFFVSQPAGSTIYGTPTIEAHDIPRARGPGVLPRLPQQAAAAEPLPDDEPVLDGGLATASTASSWTPSARTSCPATPTSTS